MDRRGPANVWVKAVHYYDDGWTIKPGEETWVSDPGVIDASGRREYRADGEAKGEPSWQVGDRVGLYFGGTYKIPVLVEIIRRPHFDPEFVARESGSTEDGERWPWVTQVRGLRHFSVDEAPSLEELEIAHSSMQQRARKSLDSTQARLLLRAFGERN